METRVRHFNLVPKAQNVTPSERARTRHRPNCSAHVRKVSSENYKDEYCIRVLATTDGKQSKETVIATAPPSGRTCSPLLEVDDCLGLCLLSSGPTSSGHVDASADVVPLGQKSLIRCEQPSFTVQPNLWLDGYHSLAPKSI